MSPRILGVGGAHVDRRGQVNGAYVPGASNPGTMREDIGGGAFNALRNAVRRGAAGAMVSLRGGDRAGDSVAAAIAADGIEDLSAVFLDRSTPSYTALLDADGDVIAGLADMGLYDMAFAKQLRRSKLREAAVAADGILCDANLPAAALERLVQIAGATPLFAIAISPAKAVRLEGIVGRLACLYMNRREATALAGDGEASGAQLADKLRDKGLRAGVVTAGGAPVLGFDAKGAFAIDPPAPRRVVDVTGAGDALAGATTVAMLRGLHLAEALREGVAAATLTIETRLAVPELRKADFEAALALVPTARPMA